MSYLNNAEIKALLDDIYALIDSFDPNNIRVAEADALTNDAASINIESLGLKNNLAGDITLADALETLNGLTLTEADPIVGAISGIIKSDGAGNISSASAGTDYLTSDTLDDTIDHTSVKPTTLGTTTSYGVPFTIHKNISNLDNTPVEIIDSAPFDFKIIKMIISGGASGSTILNKVQLSKNEGVPSTPYSFGFIIDDNQYFSNYLNNGKYGQVDVVITPLVKAATTSALPACTAAGSGVGKTLTGDANGALPNIDGVGNLLGNYILVQDQVNQVDNGIYEVTQVGDDSNPFILTRATFADEASEFGFDNKINFNLGLKYYYHLLVPVQSGGTVYGGKSIIMGLNGAVDTGSIVTALLKNRNSINSIDEISMDYNISSGDSLSILDEGNTGESYKGKQTFALTLECIRTS